MKLGRLIIPLVVSALALGFFAYHTSHTTRSVEAAPGAALFPAEPACKGGATTDVTFKWVPYAGADQWLDVGTSGDFAAGTFKGYGPYENDVDEHVVKDMSASSPIFYRVNTQTQAGWVTSNVQSMVPCGAPKLLWGPLSCDSRFIARVNFNWAPLGHDVLWQYLDLSTDPNFPAGGFMSSPKQLPSIGTYNWYNIQANVPTYFRVNALDNKGVWHTSETASFYADCAPPVRQGIIGTGDRLIIDKIGVDAPVNVRDIGPDGTMGDPAGPLDVIRYTWPLNPGYGSFPGNGGTTLIAGHLDFRYYGLAVFGHLDQLAPGDFIDYYREDGLLVSYQVQDAYDVDPDVNFGDFAKNTSVETMVLVTCNGTFDWDIEEYSARRIVVATKVAPVAASQP